MLVSGPVFFKDTERFLSVACDCGYAWVFSKKASNVILFHGDKRGVAAFVSLKLVAYIP